MFSAWRQRKWQAGWKGSTLLHQAQHKGHDGHDHEHKEQDLGNANGACRNATKAALTNVEFRKGTIEALPLADERVDVIISNCVVNLSPDKEQVLREAFRVLRPGGRLAISDVVIDGDLADLPVREEQLRQALSWAGCIAGALTIDQVKAYLAAAGFEQIDVQIQQRYSLDALGVESATVSQLLPLAAAETLARRFTSSIIAARKPAPVTVTAGAAARLSAGYLAK